MGLGGTGWFGLGTGWVGVAWFGWLVGLGGESAEMWFSNLLSGCGSFWALSSSY